MDNLHSNDSQVAALMVALQICPASIPLASCLRMSPFFPARESDAGHSNLKNFGLLRSSEVTRRAGFQPRCA
jgi:hypothetical protein